MVDAALNIAAERVVEYSAYGAVLHRAGNRGPTAAPQNLYRTSELDEFGRDDSWVAIAVETDGQWESLRPPSASRAGPRTSAWPPRSAAGRKRFGRRAPGRLVPPAHRTRWWPRCGRPGCQWPKVMQPHRQTELEQLVARGFFERLEHPVNTPALQHAAVPVLVRAAARPSGPRRCWANTTARCWPNSACPGRISTHTGGRGRDRNGTRDGRVESDQMTIGYCS